MLLVAIIIVLIIVALGIAYKQGWILAGPYTKIGCYKDDPKRDGSIRVFPLGGERIDTWTPEACMAKAKLAKAKYFGRQDTNQCYYGTDLALAQSYGEEPTRCGLSWNNEIYRIN